MSRYQVVDNVPIPLRKTRQRPLPTIRGSKYPFYRMRHGESFYADGVRYAALHSAVGKARQRMGGGFVIRPEGGGFRVWRVEK